MKIETLLQKLADDPANGDLHFALGKEYLDMVLQWSSEKQDVLNSAIKHLKEATQLNPISLDAHLQLALAHERKMDKQSALRCYEKCRQLDPENTFVAGEINRMKRHIEAEKDRNLGVQLESVRNNPANTMAWRLLGFHYSQKEMMEDAILCYRKAVELEPAVDEHYYFLAFELQKAKQHEKAIAAFEKYLELTEDHYSDNNTFHGIADSYFEMKAYGKAREYYNKEMVIDQASSIPYVGIADTFKAEKKWEEAIAMYLQAAERNVDGYFPELEISVGECYYFKGDKEQAKQWLELAVKKNGGSYRALYNIGVLMLEQKDYEGAEMVNRMALQANRLHVPAINNLGLSLFKLGESKEAIELLERAITLEPEHEPSLFLLAELYTMVSDYDRAYDYFFRYLEAGRKKREQKN